MSILFYEELKRMVEYGHIEGVDPANIGPSSIDLTLGSDVLVEDDARPTVVRLYEKEAPNMVQLRHDGVFQIYPGGFALMKTQEIFHLPNDIAGILRLKSTPGRAGVDHAETGWLDPGFHGAPATLQIKNNTQYHVHEYKVGMPLIQAVFWRGAVVPHEVSYAVRGSYNKNLEVAQIGKQ